jgi:chromosome segregation ATPase
VAEAAREAGAHQEIERLQAELAHVVACKDATETSLAQTQDAKNKIEAKLQEYEEQRVAALNSAKASEEAKKEMGRLEKELNDAVAALAESREADVAKATQIGELQDRIHDLETQVRKAAEENATAMAAAKRAATVENDFHTVRIGLEDHIRTLEEKAQGQVVEWEEKVRGSADRLLAAEQEVAALQEEKAALVEKADCQKDDLEKLKIELKETYKMKGEAAVAHETALFRMKSQLEALSEKGVRLDQVEGELERLREKRKRDLEEFKRLNAHIHDLQADRAEEMEGASRQSEELREELACLREERVRLEDHAKELEESVRGRAAENTRLHEDIQRAKKTVSKIQSTANALQSALDAKAGEIAELAAALAEKETALELAKAAEATSVISGEDVQKAEEMASLQQRLVDKEKEANALSSTITELETRLSEGEQLATLAAQKNQVTVHELERRLSVAESVRDRARQEVLNASSSLHPSVVQRGGGLKVATATGDGGVDLESQQLFENEEVRDSFTAPLYRRYPLLARLPPAIDNALSQVRRRYPEQTRWVEENVLIHIDEHRARTTYFFMLHLWLLYMLIF